MFPWGGFCTDHGYTHQCRYPTIEDPILLKTHYPFHPKKIDLESKRAICLIRHPIDAFSSFYIFKGGIPGTRIGKKKVKELIARWKGFYEFWLNQPNVLFIRYEDLHANTPFYLRSILETAGFSFHEQDIERAVMKYPPQGMVLKHIHSYQPEDIAMIKEQLSEFLIRFGYEI